MLIECIATKVLAKGYHIGFSPKISRLVVYVVVMKDAFLHTRKHFLRTV